MKSVESKKSHSWWWDSHISPKNSKWLAENLEEVDQSVKQMLKLIEEDGDSFAKKAEMYYEKRPELIAHVEEFYRMYQSLAERYDNLTGELRKNISSVLQMQGSGICDSSDQASPLLTPDQKLCLHKSGQEAVGFDLFSSSGGGSSDLSLKEGSESSSSSPPSSDSDSESFNSSINKHSGPPVNCDDKGLHQVFVELEMELPGMEEKVQVTKEENIDGTLKVRENGGYETLLRRITKYEEELRVSNKKLQLSEEEIARLKVELKKNESVIVLMGNLQAQLESAQSDVKLREADLEIEKRRVLELQKQVAVLETQVSDSSGKIGTLVKELEINREKLRVSEEDIAKLKNGLSNEIFEGSHQLQSQLELAQKDIAVLEDKLDLERRHVLELQERIVRFVADISDRDQEIKDLNVALSDTKENFYLEKAKFQSDISSLSEQQSILEARVEEWELQNKSLENEIRQHEAEKMEMKCLHESREIGLQGDIELLKAELTQRGEFVEVLNKNLDTLKLKYDALMAEKDGANAKVQTLVVDMNSRDNQLKQLEVHLQQIHMEHVELIAGSESARKLVDELRLKVAELEKEVDRQRVVISDRAEEKREAIRQLCFSLEHYRSGYQALRQAFIGHKRHAVLAS
uniref:Putative Kinase interacting family protein isoform 1 n=1 Tax=Davidia involucrata TaxID=16924 RepID=A0A5B7BUH8_DAVIN